MKLDSVNTSDCLWTCVAVYLTEGRHIKSSQFDNNSALFHRHIACSSSVSPQVAQNKELNCGKLTSLVSQFFVEIKFRSCSWPNMMRGGVSIETGFGMVTMNWFMLFNTQLFQTNVLMYK